MLRLVGRLGTALLLGLVTALVAAATRAPDQQTSERAAAAARSAIREAQIQLRSPEQQQLMERAAQATPASAFQGTGYALELPGSTAASPLPGSPETRAWAPETAVPMVVLVSFSMPESALQELARQAARLGIPLVLRGLVDDSMEATVRRLQAFQSTSGTGFAIDPTLFSRFQVEAVPTYLLLLDELQACTPEHCPVPRHVRVAGEAGLDHVLETMRRSRERGAREAAAALLARLERQP